MIRASSAPRFIDSEAAGGVVLIVAAGLAMLVANLPATAGPYQAALDRAVGPMSVHHWINDGLMALFFLTVGLEIKREMIAGELARASDRRLPFIAAGAGMAVPALVYLAVVSGHPALKPGWAIPAATDIAFAIGVLALLGDRVPAPLKLLLATIAIVDDMGAVAIIAIGYTTRIDPIALAGAGLALAVLYAIGRRGVTKLWPYLLVGMVLWALVLRSGVHATIAGVALAALVPIARNEATSPLHRLETALHPWSAFVVVPLFAFANAGVPLGGIGPDILAEPVVLAVASGLFLGKQAGIFASIWGAERLGIAARPAGVGWRQVYGMALIAGIGFTMSLFIGSLAFPGDGQLGDEVRIGVLAGSMLSALAGLAVLARAGEGRAR